ncbi:MAG: hypothetical protein FJZ56_05545 [Chlamydiae bacterium]|nr:hypothetical protein [Chlamydiota bacterium]
MISGDITRNQTYSQNLPTIEKENSSLDDASSDNSIESPTDTKTQQTAKRHIRHPSFPSLRLPRNTTISLAQEKRIAELFAKKERLIQERESREQEALFSNTNSLDLIFEKESSAFEKDDSTNTEEQKPTQTKSLKDRIALQRIPHSIAEGRFTQRLMNMSYCVPTEELQKEGIKAINNLDGTCKHKHYIDPDISDWSESKITKLHNWLGNDYGFNVQTAAKVVLLSSFILSFGIIYLLMLMTYAITDLSSIENGKKIAS